jgi:trehalose synthase
MTRLEIERFGPPATRRDHRVLNFARGRALDRLAGRTVWCATALPGGRDAAERLRGGLEWARADGVASRSLGAARPEPVEALARRLDGMLRGLARGVPRPGPADEEVYSEGASTGEELVRANIGPGDVVVVHDPLTALAAEAARECGAHVVWHVTASRAPWQDMVGSAWSFLRRFTVAVDAYLTSASDEAPPLERVALLLPCPDLVRERDIGANRGVGWGNALADVVETDRGERAGGTLHPRPVVAAR